jgi:hypothetical protein
VLVVTHRDSAAARCDRVLHLTGEGDLILVPPPVHGDAEVEGAAPPRRMSA